MWDGASRVNVTSSSPLHTSHLTPHTSHLTPHTSLIRVLVHLGCIVPRSSRPGDEVARSHHLSHPGPPPETQHCILSRKPESHYLQTLNYQTNCPEQVVLSGGVLAHAATCGASFTLVLAKPSSSSSAVAAAAASAAAAAASSKLGESSPEFSLEHLSDNGDTKSPRSRSSRFELVT